MAILVPTKRGHLHISEKIALLSDLRDIHEGSEPSIVYVHGAYRIYLDDPDGGFDGTVLECSECGYLLDELAEGNYVYDLTTCPECGSKIEDIKSK